MFTFGQSPVAPSPAPTDLVEALTQQIMQGGADYATARMVAQKQIADRGAAMGQSPVQQATPMAAAPNVAGYYPGAPVGGYANPMAGYNGIGAHNTFGMPQVSSGLPGQPKLVGQVDLEEADRLEKKIDYGNALSAASNFVNKRQEAEDAAIEEQAKEIMSLLNSGGGAEISAGVYQPVGQQTYGITPLAGRVGMSLI